VLSDPGASAPHEDRPFGGPPAERSFAGGPPADGRPADRPFAGPRPADGLAGLAPADRPFAGLPPADRRLGDRACAVPAVAGPGGPDDGRDAPPGATPRELRAQAESVLDRLRRLARPTRTWTGRSMDELDDVTGTLRVLQGRIAACGWTSDPATMGDVVRARRCVDEALVLALVALDALRGG
jgi:hypothetical protein